MRMLGRIVLCALAVALRAPSASQRIPFRKALTCVRSIVDFHLMAQYKSHTAETLNYMDQYLRDFHDHKQVFLEFRAYKATVAKAKEELRALRDEQQVRMAESQHTASSKRRAATENRQELLDAMEEIYQAESHFNFIKMHLLNHFRENVEKYGSLPMYSTEVGEASHRKQIKDGWQHSNHVNASMQILTYFARRHAIHLRKLNLLQLAREGFYTSDT
jgi:hypothetical protein